MPNINLLTHLSTYISVRIKRFLSFCTYFCHVISLKIMDTENAVSTSAKSPNAAETDASRVIEGHRACQTQDAQWLCISDIYEKLHRPNVYDIGGTYINNVPDFWFTCKIEQSHGIYLLHLFAGNRTEGTHSVGVSRDSLVYNDKEQVVRMTGEIDFYKFKCKLHNQSYINTITIENSTAENILKGKKLYIAITLVQKEKPTVNKFKNTVNSVQMHHDNAALLREPVGTDFIIESEDGVEFPVHRSVLSLQSDVFKAMLHEDMAESQTGRVKLIDVHSEDLQIMLEYIYSSAISVVENINFSNVIMLADRYNILGLRKLCDHILIDQLAPDTALHVLVIADRFDCSKVKNEALQYIKKNKELFKDSKFEEIDNMLLLKELCSMLLV